MEYQQLIKTTIGYLQINASEIGIRSILFHKEKPIVKERQSVITKLAAKELYEYFKGNRKKFSVELDWKGHSKFYQSVWKYLLTIPCGQTKSYGEIAKHLKNPGASRAVGLVNGKNPIPIIVPCHRVIGSNGALTGYASGLDIKKKLLAHENPKTFGMQGELFG